jgi:hypothetical protein
MLDAHLTGDVLGAIRAPGTCLTRPSASLLSPSRYGTTRLHDFLIHTSYRHSDTPAVSTAMTPLSTPCLTFVRTGTGIPSGRCGQKAGACDFTLVSTAQVSRAGIGSRACLGHEDLPHLPVSVDDKRCAADDHLLFAEDAVGSAEAPHGAA